jgi:hypothetical protein
MGSLPTELGLLTKLEVSKQKETMVLLLLLLLAWEDTYRYAHSD